MPMWYKRAKWSHQKKDREPSRESGPLDSNDVQLCLVLRRNTLERCFSLCVRCIEMILDHSP